MCPLPLVTAPVPYLAVPASCSSKAVCFSACQATDLSPEHYRLAPAPCALTCSICAMASVWLPAHCSAAQHLDIWICFCPPAAHSALASVLLPITSLPTTALLDTLTPASVSVPCSNSALASVQLPITSLPTPAGNASNTASPFITIGNNTALTQLDLGRLTVLPGSKPLQISNNTVLTAVNLAAVSAGLH